MEKTKRKGIMATAKKAPTSKKTTAKAAVKKTEVKAEKGNKKSCGSTKPLLIGIIVVAVVAVATFIILGVTGVFNKTNLAGTYNLVSVEADGEDQSSMIDLMKAFGLDAYINLKDDKTGTMSLFNDEAEITYDDKKIKSNDGTEIDYTYKDNKITIEQDGSKMVFEKQE